MESFRTAAARGQAGAPGRFRVPFAARVPSRLRVPSRVRRRGVAAVVALLVAVPGLSSTAGSAYGEAPAQGRPSGGPGTVLGVEPTVFRSAPGVSTDTSAWRVTYRSTGAEGRPDVVSGTVVVPHDDRRGPRPLITYAVGTVGMGDRCAPSAGFPDGTTAEAPLVGAALERGYAVAVTDYQGLGTPGDHTYTVARAEATAMLDAARAARRLPGAHERGVGLDSPVGIMGYSQGGQAAAEAAEIAASYAPRLKVRGTAAGGVPTDLAETLQSGDGGPGAGFVLMSLLGHDAAFPRLHLRGYLTPQGRRLASLTRDACVSEILDAARGRTLAELTDPNPLDGPGWRRAIAADALGTRAPSAPAFVYHGEADEIIPHAQGERLRAGWCSRGTAVLFRSFPRRDHVGAAAAGNRPALDWLTARFAGSEPPDNCPG